MKRILTGLLLGTLVVGVSLMVTPTPTWGGAQAVHIVEVGSAGNNFAPKELTINKGDTIRWVWVSGSHTTTSGTGGADPNAGDLWNAVIDLGNTEFERVFNDVGVFPYYCIPHEIVGMTGTITVQEGTPVRTISWGAVKKIFERTRPSSL